MGGGGDGGRGDQKEKKEMTRQMKKGDGHRHGPLFVVGRDPGGEGLFTFILVHVTFRIDREGAWGRVFPLILGFWIFLTLHAGKLTQHATRRL